MIKIGTSTHVKLRYQYDIYPSLHVKFLINKYIDVEINRIKIRIL